MRNYGIACGDVFFCMKKDRPMMSGLICTIKLELYYLAVLLSACAYSV